MVKIENKQTDILFTEDTKATYANLIKILINQPLREGLTVAQIRRDFQILDASEKAEDFIELSDENLKYIAQLAENTQWPIRHNDVVSFSDYLNELVANLK